MSNPFNVPGFGGAFKGMEYRATLSVDTTSVTEQLTNMRSGLASTNYLLRMLGLPPEQRQALVQIQRSIAIFRTLQMVSQGTGLMRLGTMAARSAGLGRFTGAIRVVKKLAGN